MREDPSHLLLSCVAISFLVHSMPLPDWDFIAMYLSSLLTYPYHNCNTAMTKLLINIRQQIKVTLRFYFTTIQIGNINA